MGKQNKEQKVDDYRLVIVDNHNHKQLWVFSFKKAEFWVTVVSSVVAFIVLIYCLIAFTPIRKSIPGYPDSRSKQAAVQTAIKVDSLERVISRWELYSENLRRVFDGEQPLKLDSLLRNSGTGTDKSRSELSRQDSILRNNVISQEKFSVSEKKRRNLPIEGMHFFPPLKGVISQGYDKVIHPYIDITAPANSVVMSVLDGTVIFAGWNEDYGYTIQIQHENDIVSIYKHNMKLLKTTGDKVKAGTPIALVGNTGNLSTGEHLHFELWYKGEAVDATKYISF
ncbi:MAG: M23 family metallopeptidase [Candidatus Cryptobacteroides sp.]